MCETTTKRDEWKRKWKRKRKKSTEFLTEYVHKAMSASVGNMFVCCQSIGSVADQSNQSRTELESQTTFWSEIKDYLLQFLIIK